MAIVYRFRVLFEEHEDVFRDIEIKSGQTFEDLHHAIQKAISFDGSQMASFYMSTDTWRKGKEIALMDVGDDDKAAALMHKSILSDFIDDPHQKIIYVFDFMAMWTFYIELIKILPAEEAKVTYPRVVKSGGVAPKQYKGTIKPPSEDDEELDGKKKTAGIFDEFENFEGEEGDEDEEDSAFGFDAEDVPEGEEGPEQFQKGGYEE